MLDIGPIKRVLAELSAITNSAKVVDQTATAARNQKPLRVFCAFGDDVDNPINGVGAPERAAWAADHFDPINVVQKRVLNVPKHTGVKRRIDASAIHQYQKLVG